MKQPEKKKPETVQKKKPLWLIPAAAALVCILIAAFATGAKESPALSVETTLPPVTEQSVPTVTPDPIPETVPLTYEEKAYNEAVDLFYQGEYGKAAIAFGKLGDFQDAREISIKIWDAIADRETISAGYNHTVGVKDDGTVVAVGSNNYGQCNVKDWTDIVAVSAGNDHTVGLKSDGTVVATGMGGSDWFSVDDWSDIVAIYAGRWLTIGLRSNGTLVSSATGQALSSLDCLNWEDIVSLGIGTYTNRCIGLKSDGAVICDNESIKWNNIIDISIDQTTAALCSDGTVYVMDPVPSPNSQKSNSVQNWTDIVKIDTGIDHILGLKSDGTVIASGDNKNKEGNVSNWTDIVAISAGGDYSVGLKADGTVVSKGQSYNGKRTASKWTNIKLPADRDALLSQIKPQHITPGGQAAVDITKNILMPVSDKVTDGESEFLNMSISRKQIRSITFLNTLKNVPQDAIDVSADGNGQVLAWSNYSDNRHDVFIAAEYGVIAPRNCAYLFYCMKNLQSIDFGNAFDTSNVTNMNHMFGQCHAVTSLDLSIFNTSKVTDMANMFDLCMNITELNVTSFDTSNVTNMAAMFAWCTDLKDLDLSHFDTSKVTTMNSMFDHCQNLKNLDLSGFDISNLADMKYMFLECPAKAPKWYRSK